MGVLRRQAGRAGEVFSFEYDRDWLKATAVFSFDPDLALVQGPQYPAANRTNFGIFLDSAPDRWGRVLMQRRENMRARREGRAARSLTDWDFLLGVHDETRLGALRFQDPATGSWLDTEDSLAARAVSGYRIAPTPLSWRSDSIAPRAADAWLSFLP
jgi:serine/threonine-protein kinase HipA